MTTLNTDPDIHGGQLGTRGQSLWPVTLPIRFESEQFYEGRTWARPWPPTLATPVIVYGVRVEETGRLSPEPR